MLGAFLVIGRSGAALGSAVAVAVAYMCGNFTLANLSFDEPIPTWENTSRLLLWKPVESSPGYQWLPRAALVLLIVGLVTRWLGLFASRLVPERAWWSVGLLVWLPRAAAVYVVSAWLVLGHAAADPKWASLRWELVASMLLAWLVLDGLARNGLSASVSAYLATMFLAGGMVLLYSHNAKFMELAVVIGSAMFGIAVVVCVASVGGPLSASGAIPAAVVFLPGLVLGTRPSHDETKVPAISFWLVALAPLLLAPFLIPREPAEPGARVRAARGRRAGAAPDRRDPRGAARETSLRRAAVVVGPPLLIHYRHRNRFFLRCRNHVHVVCVC